MDRQISNESYYANMDNALEVISQYCRKYGFDYAFTGTVALDLLGAHIQVNPPQDIDLLIGYSEKADSCFSELERLSGLRKEAYKDAQEMSTRCYTFAVFGIKVNALMNSSTEEAIRKETVSITRNNCIFNVHKVKYAILAKAKLHRLKDYRYFNNLIHWITEML